MKTFVFALFSLLSIGLFAQETTEVAEEFIPIEIEGKEAFISTKTGEYTYREHSKTDPEQLKTTASGVVYTDIKTHTIKKGETLSAIAKKSGITVSELKKHNKVNASNLKLGSQLKVVKKILVKSSSPVKGTSGDERIIARLRPGESPGALAPPPPMEEIQKKLVKTKKTTEKPTKPTYKVKKDIKNPVFGLENSTENNEVVEKEVEKTETKKERLTRLKAEMKALEEELEETTETVEEIKETKVVTKKIESKAHDAHDGHDHSNHTKEEVVVEVEVVENKTEEITSESSQKDNKAETKESTAEKATRIISEVRKTKTKEAETKVEKETSKGKVIVEIEESKSTPETKESAENYYTVDKGNSLWSIARKHNMTVDELKKLNNLKNNNLDIGQKLKVKPKSKK